MTAAEPPMEPDASKPEPTGTDETPEPSLEVSVAADSPRTPARPSETTPGPSLDVSVAGLAPSGGRSGERRRPTIEEAVDAPVEVMLEALGLIDATQDAGSSRLGAPPGQGIPSEVDAEPETHAASEPDTHDGDHFRLSASPSTMPGHAMNVTTPPATTLPIGPATAIPPPQPTAASATATALPRDVEKLDDRSTLEQRTMPEAPEPGRSVTRTATAPLASPDRLKVIRQRPHSVRLGWSAPAGASSETVYRISLWHPSDRKPSQTIRATEHKFGDLTPGLEYTVELLAIDGDRISQVAKLIVVTPPVEDEDFVGELVALVRRHAERDRKAGETLVRSIASQDKISVRAAVLAILEAVLGWLKVRQISPSDLKALTRWFMGRRG